MEALLLLLTLPPAPAADDYYFIVGAYQAGCGPRGAHSWSVFVHRGPDGKEERVCLSWMPSSEKVRLLSGPRRGVNWSEQQTKEHARRIGAAVTEFGPYRVSAATFAKAQARAAELQRGRWLYKALDGPGRDSLNCIHGADITGQWLYSGLAYGRRASEMLAAHLLRSER